MKNLNNKVNSLTQKLNSKIVKLDKLNAQIERTNKLIDKYKVELGLKDELYNDYESIRGDILSLKEEFVNDSTNFLLDNIESFAKTILSKFKELDSTEKKFLKYMNTDIDAVNDKIEAATTLNNNKKHQIEDLKAEIADLEYQINKLKTELTENSEDDSWDFNTEDVEDVEEIDV
jgi:peptidoglycan hydrolase CwlO-like protein